MVEHGTIKNYDSKTHFGFVSRQTGKALKFYPNQAKRPTADPETGTVRLVGRIPRHEWHSPREGDAIIFVLNGNGKIRSWTYWNLWSAASMDLDDLASTRDEPDTDPEYLEGEDLEEFRHGQRHEMY